MIEIREDDVTGEATQALVALHLSGMRANTPEGHVFALDYQKLQVPEVTVWSAWRGGEIAGIGALLALRDGVGEVKSMRTHPDHLRCGVAAAILDRIIAEARNRGYRRLSLETGRGESFEPALELYRKRGFVSGGAFEGYEASPYNQFMHLDLD